MKNQAQIKKLIRALSSENEEVLITVANDLKSLGAESIDYFVSSLRNEDGDIWDKAVEVLITMDKPVIEPLNKIFNDQSRTVNERYLALLVIGMLDDSRSIPLLIQALSDPCGDIQGGAGFILEWIGVRAIPYLEAALPASDLNTRSYLEYVIKAIREINT